MAEKTLKKMLEILDSKIEHIEDMTADNRSVIIKLVKQNNQIVEFLKELDLQIEDVMDDDILKSSISKKQQDVHDLIEKYITKHKDLVELEKELAKHKNEITPGQIGEA